jgi:hypothetical protein
MAAVRDLRAYLGTMVSRGLDQLYARRFFNAYAVLNRSIKMRGDKDKLNQFVLPIAFAYVPLTLRGGGGLPFTIYGASIDSLIAVYAAKYPEFHDYLNKAANVLDAKLPDVARDIVNQIVEGKVTVTSKDGSPRSFSDGLDFINKHVLTKSRIDAAVSAQKRLVSKKAAVPPSMFYPNVGKAILSRATANSNSIQTIQNSYLRDQGGAYHLRSQEPTKELVLGAFPWVQHVMYEETGLLTSSTKSVPWGLIDPVTRGLFQTFGFNYRKPTRRVTVDGLRRLLSSDKAAAAFVSPEALYNLLADSRVTFDKEVIILTCLAVGVQRRTAQLIAMEYERLEGSRIFKAQASKQSFADQLLVLIDHSGEAVRRVVSLPHHLTRDVESLLGDVGLMLSIAEYARTGLPRTYKVPMTQELNASIFRDLQGKADVGYAATLMNLYETERERQLRFSDRDDT